MTDETVAAPVIGQGHLFTPPPPVGPSLSDRFLVPPFTVLDARSGYWLDRKRGWLAYGIKSEVGRDGHMTIPGPTGRDPELYQKKRDLEAQLSQQAGEAVEITTAEYLAEHYVNEQKGGGISETGTSVFDPVLSELVYRWFCPRGGAIYDPFAGGSVRGIVAGILGYRYLGIDLREEQVVANREQAKAICPQARVAWARGDSRSLPTPSEPVADLVFSCPPYYDLEAYSDDPRDLSAAPTYEAFLEGYRQVIESAVSILAPNRFAAFVVADVRDRKTGWYRGLVADTIRAFTDYGAPLYNEFIFLTPLGSVPVRAARMFSASRKAGKAHQNLLVFCKGDPVEAVALLPDEIGDEL